MSTELKDTGWAKCVGAEKDHLKISAVQRRSKPISGIGFNLGDKLLQVQNKQLFDAVYSVDENVWNGNVTLQMRLKDIK